MYVACRQSLQVVQLAPEAWKDVFRTVLPLIKPPHKRDIPSRIALMHAQAQAGLFQDTFESFASMLDVRTAHIRTT